MVGPEADGPVAGGEPLVEPAAPTATAAFAGVAAAAGIGAFAAGFGLAHGEALQRGASLPVQGWLSGWPDWLPWACIGFGLVRLTLVWPAGRNLLRAAAIVLALAVAGAELLGVGTWSGLLAVAGALLGAAVGWRLTEARWLGVFAVPLFGLSAAVAAIAAGYLTAASAAFALAMVLSLGAMTPALPGAAPAAVPGGRWWLALAAWIPVLVGTWFVVVDSVPAAAPRLGAFVAILLAAGAIGRVGIACGATAVMLAADVLMPQPAPAADQVLARCGDAALVYIRKHQELQLRLGGEVVCAAGPDRDEEPLCAALVHALARDGDRVLLLGGGTGRVGLDLARARRLVVERTATFAELATLQRRAVLDGPVPPPATWPGIEVPVPTRAYRGLRELPDASRQVVVVGEWPTAATAHRASVAFQRQLRRVVGAGLVLQPIALDRVAPERLRRLFLAARAAHPWNGVFTVGEAAVLVSAVARPPVRRHFSAWSDAARWALHRAHLGGPHDVVRALRGVLPVRAPLRVDGAWVDWLAPAESAPATDAAPEAPARERSLLLRWRERRERARLSFEQVQALADTPADRGRAAELAARMLPVGAPSAWMAAALGLADASGVALREPALASRIAFAIDPTFFRSPPPVFASLPRPVQTRGDLEDLMRVEPGERLAVRCCGDTPLAAALRARFPSRCARALLGRLARGPLDTEQALALRSLADPFVLAEAARVLLPAGRWRELLPLWRLDVPAPTALATIAHAGDRDDCVTLCAALAGRSDAAACALVADFLVADDRELVRLAAVCLRQVCGESVPFDPAWPRSRRLVAASRLRALHNRKP